MLILHTTAMKMQTVQIQKDLSIVHASMGIPGMVFIVMVRKTEIPGQ